jgi:DedD protein
VALGTAVLVVGGFGAGLFVGALWEAPERVLAPFRDGQEPVPLADILANPTGTTEAPAPLEPEPAAVPQADTGEALEVATIEALDAPSAGESEPPPVAAAPPAAGPWSVQVASFPDPVPAWKLAEDLGEQDYEVYVDEGDAAGAARWRVRVGPVGTSDEAERLAARLAAAGLDTWVVDEGARP